MVLKDLEQKGFLKYTQYLLSTFVIFFVSLIFTRKFGWLRNMGEIDTKPIESVQTALSLFGEKGDQRKNRSAASDDEKERELESVLEDLANYKVQLEAKEAAYMHALLKLEQSQKTVDELSTLMKNIETERDRYEEECRGARTRIEELESEIKDMADQLSETANIREQLSQVLHELEAANGELLCKETEIGAAKDSELKALKMVETLEVDMDVKSLKCEDLVKRISELDDAILVAKDAAIEAEKEKFSVLSEKDAEIEVAKKALVETEERLEDMKREMEMMKELENQLLSNSLFVDELQLQLKEANERLSISEGSAVDAFTDLRLLQEELEFKDRKSSSQEVLIEAFKMEVIEVKLELKNANELASHLMADVEMLTGDLQEAKTEVDEMRRRETEAQVEIALLNSELHRGRSKVVAAEAAEARAESVKTGLYLTVQELAVEAESAKQENQRLKQAADKENELDAPEIEEQNTEAEETKHDNNVNMTISHAEDESLIKRIPKSVTEDSSQLTAHKNKNDLESLRKELDAATAKVAEFRNRAEQAICRAEMAERAKTAIEDQLRKWREEGQKKKAALAAPKEVSAPKELTKEVSAPKESSMPTDNKPQVTYYQPLYKILNMKF